MYRADSVVPRYFKCHLASFPSPLGHEEVSAELPDCGENTFDTNHLCIQAERLMQKHQPFLLLELSPNHLIDDTYIGLNDTYNLR